MYNGNGGQKVLVLYRIANSVGDGSQYNAFEMSKIRGGVNLSAVQQHCHALQILSRAGPAGYQWRVRVDDRVPHKNTSNLKPGQKYSWWDIQDEKAPLPVKDVTFSELNRILAPPPEKSNAVENDDPVAKAASGAMRSLGKAMNKVAATVEGNSSALAKDDNFPRVSILVFKLLDLIKIHDSFPKRLEHQTKTKENNSSRPTTGENIKQQSSANYQAHVGQNNAVHKATSQPKASSTPELLNFNDPVPQASNGHQRKSYPLPTVKVNAPTETRVEKLSREYKEKKEKQNLVWDEVDKRFVTPDSNNGETVTSTNIVKEMTPKVKGISLDSSNAVGKSAHVANAIKERVNNMKEAQQKALDGIREREMKKKQEVAEEDQIRHKIDPLIKAWSEEHGKKKHLSALLANLHTVLWPGAEWTPVNLGDILDEKKCRRCFHKASRVVHPDRTIKLNVEQRFLAKRIFDALKQAKAVMDNS